MMIEIKIISVDRLFPIWNAPFNLATSRTHFWLLTSLLYRCFVHNFLISSNAHDSATILRSLSFSRSKKFIANFAMHCAKKGLIGWWEMFRWTNTVKKTWVLAFWAPSKHFTWKSSFFTKSISIHQSELWPVPGRRRLGVESLFSFLLLPHRARSNRHHCDERCSIVFTFRWREVTLKTDVHGQIELSWIANLFKGGSMSDRQLLKCAFNAFGVRISLICWC